MDKLTKEKRSWNMSRIKGKNTKPELSVRSFLHKHGFRFRLHRKDLPGCPDIVLPKYRTAIFVHGCFWHHHLGCKYAYLPKSNREFWNSKFKKTVERDSSTVERLKHTGWNVLIVWECQCKKSSNLKNALAPLFAIRGGIFPAC